MWIYPILVDVFFSKIKGQINAEKRYELHCMHGFVWNTIIQQQNGRIEQTDDSLLLDIYFLNKIQ